ncbi:baeRF12 domain-containing protein [Alteromonas halophila]|uniref:Host attachment protein n=1 Tax=Alteromonas halophila TaxID=516698 RepID=A0A918JRY0_9ALTE|nr:host attachment protein [Alteromonas halophila]GGW93367.1 hypothetical protein GCM10007391_29640 [Alteromonas halophila]
MVGQSFLLVANRSEAKVFVLQEKGTALEFEKSWSNRFGHSSDQDIYTDKPGRQPAPSAQGHVGDSMPRKDATEQEAERFAGDVIDWLDNKRKTSKIYHIDIIAESGFLGKLRGKMNKQLEELVEKVVDKDVVNADEDRLLAYLKD